MRRKTFTPILLTLLLCLGAAGVSGVAQAGGTSRTFTASAAASTRGFWIDNMSTKSLKLTQVRTLTGEDNKELLPVGYVISPGETAHSELDTVGGAPNRVVYDFDVLDADSSVHSRITVGMVLMLFGVRYQAVIANTPVKAGAKPTVPSGDKDTSGGNWALDRLADHVPVADRKGPVDGQNIGVYDPQGTTYDGTELSPSKQGQLLENFCSRDAATCKFIKKDPPGEFKTRSMPVYLAGGQGPNSSCDDIVDSISTDDTRVVTQSWEFSSSFKGGAKDIWEASFTAKYGGSVQNSHKFAATKTMKVRSGYIGYFASTVPVYRWQVQWEITVRLNGSGQPMSTITINGTVDIPNPNEGLKAAVEGVTDPMTDQERAVIAQKCKPLG